MEWIHLNDEQQIDEIKQLSITTPLVIFKHSTRCAISGMAKNRLERSPVPQDIPFYLLDLIKYRPISNKVAHVFDVQHESPQVLVILNGDCIYDESHSGIDMQDIVKHAKAA